MYICCSRSGLALPSHPRCAFNTPAQEVSRRRLRRALDASTSSQDVSGLSAPARRDDWPHLKDQQVVLLRVGRSILPCAGLRSQMECGWGVGGSGRNPGLW